MNTFNEDSLLSICKDRGFYRTRDVYDSLGKVIGIEPASMRAKVREGKFTLEQTTWIAGALEMTPKEYCDTFLNGLFVETASGTYRCKPMLMKQPTRKETKLTKQQQAREETLKFFDDLKGR